MLMCILKFWIIFLIPSIENWFGDDEVIFQDDNASCYWVKGIKEFIQERSIKINGMASKQNIALNV